MYRKILVPLDGSKTAECTFGHVIEIARGCNVSEVDLLFVVESLPAGLYQSRQEDHDKLVAWGKEYLNGVVKRLTDEGVTAKPVIIDGNAANTILEYADENGIDLIIMSTHGRSGPSRWAFGSVTDKVVRLSRTPVLVVAPEGCRVQIDGG
jgi:nucleotide-binding universal stress UspA family protein